MSSGVNGLTIDQIALSVSPTPQGRNSKPYQSRRVCAGNTNCIPICPIQAKYDASVTMNDALQTGNVQVRYNAPADRPDDETISIAIVNYESHFFSPWIAKTIVSPRPVFVTAPVTRSAKQSSDRP